MGATRVLVDANVLWRRALRDWLFLLRNATEGEMFTVCATEDIVAETIYTLRRRYREAPGHLTRSAHDTIVDALDYRIDDFPAGDAGFAGTDVNDTHVHAAAVADGVSIVLTADKGFTNIPVRELEALPYEVYRPDDFFVLIDDSSPLSVRAVASDQLQYWCDRRESVNLADMLEAAGCPEFGERVRRHLQAL